MLRCTNVQRKDSRPLPSFQCHPGIPNSIPLLIAGLIPLVVHGVPNPHGAPCLLLLWLDINLLIVGHMYSWSWLCLRVSSAKVLLTMTMLYQKVCYFGLHKWQSNRRSSLLCIYCTMFCTFQFNGIRSCFMF